ncbi:MAG: thioredoxin domain-containing protein [Myxococcaceae bacterium]|nr:thioredoxin domain-containing protein [Myxococcaceae bacterium]
MSLTTLAQGNDPARILSELPGFDFSRLSAAAKKELVSVLTDEFDACGRPLTLYASLKKGDACKHTRRLVGYAAFQASEGSPATETLNALAKYNQSFTAKRAKLAVDERQCVGPKDAKVTLVEFSDFECPYCNAARPMIEEVIRARPQVRVCYALFPLAGHANSTMAGQAALFARDNGRFLTVSNALFDNQTSLSDALIRTLVKKAGLDEKAFDRAVADKKYLDELNASKEAGKAGGVDSTPTVFVNGRKVTLAFSVETLLLAIDDETDWIAGNSSWTGN